MIIFNRLSMCLCVSAGFLFYKIIEKMLVKKRNQQGSCKIYSKEWFKQRQDVNS